MSNDLFNRLHDAIEADDPSRADERRIDSGDGLDLATLAADADAAMTVVGWSHDEDGDHPIYARPSGDRVECGECAETIVFGTTGWSHVLVPDVPHWPTPACTCVARFADVPDPYCRVHGLEDVVSGCYDLNLKERKRIDRAVAEFGDDR